MAPLISDFRGKPCYWAVNQPINTSDHQSTRTRGRARAGPASAPQTCQAHPTRDTRGTAPPDPAVCCPAHILLLGRLLGTLLPSSALCPARPAQGLRKGARVKGLQGRVKPQIYPRTGRAPALGTQRPFPGSHHPSMIRCLPCSARAHEVRPGPLEGTGTTEV